MEVEYSRIDGVVIVKSHSVEDHRGSLSRLFCQQELASVIAERQIVQINVTNTKQVGAVRGFHFQNSPYAEMKLIRCLRGAVWDVAVDLRRDSATFLQWFAQELTAENGQMMVIPEGCAHGFQVLEADSQLLYLHTEFYTPEAESALNVQEPKLAVNWPLDISGLSQRDRDHSFLKDDFTGIVL